MLGQGPSSSAYALAIQVERVALRAVFPRSKLLIPHGSLRARARVVNHAWTRPIFECICFSHSSRKGRTARSLPPLQTPDTPWFPAGTRSCSQPCLDKAHLRVHML